jgi:hypothetical protein
MNWNPPLFYENLFNVMWPYIIFFLNEYSVDTHEHEPNIGGILSVCVHGIVSYRQARVTDRYWSGNL